MIIFVYFIINIFLFTSSACANYYIEEGRDYKTYENHVKYGSSTMEADKAFIKRRARQKKVFSLYSAEIYPEKEINIKQFYNKNGCNGDNVSPGLLWKNPPENTQSFAITIFDKTALNGSGWWHWIIYDISTDYNEIPVNANNIKKYMPKKVKQNMNDFGEKKYSGICPTDDDKHTYIITIYALDVSKLDISKNATPAMAIFNINKHTISTAKIISTYQTPAGKIKDEENRKKRASKKKQKKTSNIKKKNNNKNIRSSIRNFIKGK